MTAKLDRNLRSGNLKEELGLLLLKGIAAVAEVQRTEDVGIDAIATALRPESTRELHAEKTFFVQLKSDSVKTIEYKQEHIAWLRNLRLPIMFGFVNGDPGGISLYPGHSLSCMFPWEITNDLIVHPRGQPEGIDEDELDRNVYLGDPLLEWDVIKIFDASYLKKAYGLLTDYLALEEGNIIQRPLRLVNWIRWETNKCVQQFGECVTTSVQGNEVELAIRAIVPSIVALAGRLTDKEERETLRRMVRLVRKYGVSIGLFDSLKILTDGEIEQV
jgi:hypothetical protein